MNEWNPGLLDAPLAEIDPLMANVLREEAARQRDAISLLAPSMLTPLSVRQALSSLFNDLDAEGYAGRWQAEALGELDRFRDVYAQRGPRKYNPSGPFAEYVELLAAARLAHLFSSDTSLTPEELYVNVQPISGSSANIAILRALLEPGDALLSLSVSSGGHLSHGARFHYSGSTYRVSHYEFSSCGTLDMDVLKDRIRECQPKVVIVGGSSYPRALDWRSVRELLDSFANPPLLFADVAHFAGLIATSCYPNPVPFADVVSMVGYKTLGGPRIGVIITRDERIARRVDRALFPGVQSAPVMGAIAALAVAARFARTDAFRSLIANSLRNARVLAHSLKQRDLELEFGGTDTHMLLLRLHTPTPPIVSFLESTGILANSNMLPGDVKPSEARGIRMGTIGLTQRGLNALAAQELASLIVEVVNTASNGHTTEDLEHCRRRVQCFAAQQLYSPAIFEPGYC
jgi:glycine hydroxymethyltransferase